MILEKVQSGKTLDDALDAIRGRDVASACSDLLYRYFRSKASTDFRLSVNSSGVVGKKIPAKFARLLGLVLTQCERQDGIGRHAAVDVAVGHARKKYGRRVGGFVNAVLRRLLDAGPALPDDAPAHVRSNLPELVYRRWGNIFSESEIACFADLYSVESSLSFRSLRSVESVRGMGERLPELSWAEGHDFFRLSKGANLFESDPWRRGEVYVQDLSTLSPCLLYRPSPDDIVYDMCSAPGGKALIIRGMMTGGILVCCDISLRRHTRTRENIERTGIEGVSLVVCSGSIPALRPGSADCVILDVPCTGTGVFRRRPDVLWSFSKAKLDTLCEIQREILGECSNLVNPGGLVIYSTCSLEPEENRKQVDKFLSCHKEFVLEDERMLLPCDLHDGSYAAALRTACPA